MAWRHAGGTAQNDHSCRIGIYVPGSSLLELCVCMLLIVSLACYPGLWCFYVCVCVCVNHHQ